MHTGRWELTTEYARRLQAMSQSEREAEAKQRVGQIIQACKKAGRVTLDKVVQSTRQPEPYRIPSKKTVDEVEIPICTACSFTLVALLCPAELPSQGCLQHAD